MESVVDALRRHVQTHNQNQANQEKSSKKTNAKKYPTTWVEMPPRGARELKVGAPGSKNTSKIDPGRDQKKVPKPLWYQNAEMSPNLTIYYTLTTSRHLREPLFSMIFWSKLVPKSDPKENCQKVDEKTHQKHPGCRRGRPKVVPRVPQGSQNGIQNRWKFNENSVWEWTWLF